MKKLISLALTLAMCLSLVACGGGDTPAASTPAASTPAASAPAANTPADIQPAIDAFNAAANAFDALANTVNDNFSDYTEELLDTLITMSESMSQTKAVLEGSPEMTEEQVQELVAQLNDIESWSKDVYENLDTFVIQAPVVDRAAVIEAFNYVSPRFDAISAQINANPGEYADEFIDGMIDIANGMIAYKEALESGAELDEETCTAMLQDLQLIDEWITTQEEAVG